MILRVLRLFAGAHPWKDEGKLGFYICLPLTVAVFPSSNGKSAISPPLLPAHADTRTFAIRQCLYRRCESGESLSGTLIDMQVWSAPVAFKDSLSLGTVVTAVQVVSL